MTTKAHAMLVLIAGAISIGVFGALYYRTIWGELGDANLVIFGDLHNVWRILTVLPCVLIGFCLQSRPIVVSAFTSVAGWIVEFFLQDGFTAINGVGGSFWPSSEYAFSYFSKLLIGSAIAGLALGTLGFGLRHLTSSLRKRWA